MTTARYRNAAQQRVLHTLRLLADLSATGASPSDIAARIGTLRSNTTRDLANLRIAGLATSSNGRWYASSEAAACLRNQKPATEEAPIGDVAVVMVQAGLTRRERIHPRRTRAPVAHWVPETSPAGPVPR